MYILIIIMWGSSAGITQSIEFKSQQSCANAALKVLDKLTVDHFIVKCVEK